MLQRSFEDLRSSKILVRRFIFVFAFGPFLKSEESLKLRRFHAEDCEDLPPFLPIIILDFKQCFCFTNYNYDLLDSSKWHSDFPHVDLKLILTKLRHPHCTECHQNMTYTEINDLIWISFTFCACASLFHFFLSKFDGIQYNGGVYV